MDLKKIIDKKIFECTEKGVDPLYLLMDRQSYFELKLNHYKTEDLAIEFELEEYNGLKVFYNDQDTSFVDVR